MAQLLNSKAKFERVPDKPVIGGPVGWICPKCGAGMAPCSSRCPCVPLPFNQPIVTC